MSRKRDRWDRIEYRSMLGDSDRRDQIQRTEPQENKPTERKSSAVDPNAKTQPLWRNGPPDELYPDDDRRS